jgi:hypothetical protein
MTRRASTPPAPSLNPELPPEVPPTPDPHPFFQSPQTSDQSPYESPEPGPSSLPSPSSPSPASDAGSPSDTRSTEPAAKPLGKAQLRKFGEIVFVAACELAASVLTHPESIERAEGLWLPDDQEREIVGGSLAGMAARRMPAGTAGPDTSDVVGLVLGLAKYVTRNLGKRAELRKAYAAPAPDGEQEAGA